MIKFPHFPRKITAPIETSYLKNLCWAFFVFIFLVNLFPQLFFDSTREKTLRFLVMKNPTVANFHQLLADEYLIINEKAAEREYQLAEEFYRSNDLPTTNIFGSESPWQTWLNLKAQRQKLKREIEFWEEVRIILPDYQHAGMNLTALNLQLGNKNKAKEYLEELLYESPTDKITLFLSEKLK